MSSLHDKKSIPPHLSSIPELDLSAALFARPLRAVPKTLSCHDLPLEPGASREQGSEQGHDAGHPGAAFVVDLQPTVAREARSEERRVGKECRSRRSPYH